ncbi:MAG: amidohydrolase family protein [Spirochaetaceae bacterium]
MSEKLVYGRYVIIDSETCIDSGAVLVREGKVVEAGKYAELKKAYPKAEEIGSGSHMVLPGFIDAHDHGKGLTDFQRGHLDDTLETWKFRSYPPVDLYSDTLWNAIKHLEAGVTTTMHNHDLKEPDTPGEEFNSVLDAYEEAGINVAFAPTLSNRNWFVYGDNEAFVDSLPENLRGVCRKRMEVSKTFGPDEYLKAVDSLYRERRGEKVRIMHGPISPQWVDEETLKRIRKDAHEKGIPIHIHVQQTQLQKLYGYKEYGKSLVAYLDDLEFLGPDVTLGHAVWVSQEDMDRIARAGSSVTHHAACNLRVRNGISPVYAMLQKGIRVGIGMDDKEFGDDKDYIEEMRLVSKLHRIPSHHLDSGHLLPKDAFKMGTEHGAAVLGFEGEIGTLHKGKRADMVLLDVTRAAEPFVSPGQTPIDLLVYRCGTRDVDKVLVDGKLVVDGGRVVHVDRDRVVASLGEALTEEYEAELEEMNAQWRQLRPHIAQWFEGWYKEMEEFGVEPFYHLNNRT